MDLVYCPGSDSSVWNRILPERTSDMLSNSMETSVQPSDSQSSQNCSGTG